LRAAAILSRGGDLRQRGGVFLIEGEEKFQPLQLVGERSRALAGVNSGVQPFVGVEERARHRERIVKVCERRSGKRGARIEDGLGPAFDARHLRRRRLFGPREVVIDELV
jgi:hypothetical protein